MSFWKGFQEPIFSTSTEFYQQVFRALFTYQKRVFKSASLKFSKEFFWAFHSQIYLVILLKSVPLLNLSYKTLVCESVFVCNQEVIIKYFTFVFEEVGGCGLGELVGLCVLLFLREQVRDLRVQESLCTSSAWIQRLWQTFTFSQLEVAR